MYHETSCTTSCPFARFGPRLAERTVLVSDQITRVHDRDREETAVAIKKKSIYTLHPRVGDGVFSFVTPEKNNFMLLAYDIMCKLQWSNSTRINPPVLCLYKVTISWVVDLHLITPGVRHTSYEPMKTLNSWKKQSLQQLAMSHHMFLFLGN